MTQGEDQELVPHSSPLPSQACTRLRCVRRLQSASLGKDRDRGRGDDRNWNIGAHLDELKHCNEGSS